MRPLNDTVDEVDLIWKMTGSESLDPQERERLEALVQQDWEARQTTTRVVASMALKRRSYDAEDMLDDIAAVDAELRSDQSRPTIPVFLHGASWRPIRPTAAELLLRLDVMLDALAGGAFLLVEWSNRASNRARVMARGRARRAAPDIVGAIRDKRLDGRAWIKARHVLGDSVKKSIGDANHEATKFDGIADVLRESSTGGASGRRVDGLAFTSGASGLQIDGASFTAEQVSAGLAALAPRQRQLMERRAEVGARSPDGEGFSNAENQALDRARNRFLKAAKEAAPHP